MKQYGLIGRTLGHSWSKPIHKAFGKGDYQLWPIEPEQLAAKLADETIGFINVTIPYKQAVMPYCQHLDPLAEEIGAVNTIVRRDDGLYGYNTDAYGFLYMAEVAGISFAGKKVMVLGAGGASHMVQIMAKREGAQEVVVVSRKGENNFTNLEGHVDTQIIVNATPVGQYPHAGVAAVDLTQFPQCEGVLDLVYNPQHTALILQAEKLGLPCCDGIPMLVAQAKKAEELWLDITIDDAENATVTNQLRHTMTNIVLVGMPSCGKTTVGELLAKLSGRPALDLDQAVEQTAGCTIPQVFETQGEVGFRALERSEIAKAGQGSGQILVTGGGAVKDVGNHDALRQNGRVYHLLRDVDKLSRQGRPLSANADLHALWQERAPLYEQISDVLVDNNVDPQEAANLIWRDFCEHFGHQWA